MLILPCCGTVSPRYKDCQEFRIFHSLQKLPIDNVCFVWKKGGKFREDSFIIVRLPYREFNYNEV